MDIRKELNIYYDEKIFVELNKTYFRYNMTGEHGRDITGRNNMRLGF